MKTIAKVIPCRSSGFEKTDQSDDDDGDARRAPPCEPRSSRADSRLTPRLAAILQPSHRRLPYDAAGVGTEAVVTRWPDRPASSRERQARPRRVRAHTSSRSLTCPTRRCSSSSASTTTRSSPERDLEVVRDLHAQKNHRHLRRRGSRQGGGRLSVKVSKWEKPTQHGAWTGQAGRRRPSASSSRRPYPRYGRAGRRHRRPHRPFPRRHVAQGRQGARRAARRRRRRAHRHRPATSSTR